MRNDIKVKSILKRNGLPFKKWNKNTKAPTIIADGIEVTQFYGQVVIYTNGFIEKSKVEELLKDFEIIVY